MKTILIINPDSANDSISEYVDRHGFISVLAHDATTALALIRRRPFDVIVTELNLPDMDGIDFLADARRELQDTPVIIISNRCDLETYLHAVDLGVVEYLQNPPLMKELIRVIRLALERRGPCTFPVVVSRPDVRAVSDGR